MDTIVCLNVLEHIEDDVATLADLHALLPTGGRLVLIVPALARLYGTLDVHLHHFRRYEKAELEQKIRDAGFALEDVRFLNRPGIVGWYVNGNILRRRVLPPGQLAAFRLLLPMLQREAKNPPSIGMSLLAIARKLRDHRFPGGVVGRPLRPPAMSRRAAGAGGDKPRPYGPRESRTGLCSHTVRTPSSWRAISRSLPRSPSGFMSAGVL